MFSDMTNNFLTAVKTQKGSAYTENGAISYLSTGSELIDQFGKVASYRGRPISIVFEEQEHLWNENPTAAIRFPFYLRLITRKPKTLNKKEFDTIQKGAGARDEALKRILWLGYNHPEHFYDNLWLLPAVGSWRDIWELLAMDLECKRNIDNEKVFSLIAMGLSSDDTSGLVKKYLPRITSSKKCTTTRRKNMNLLAKRFVSFANKGIVGGFTEKDYRLLKTSGNAHKFQQLITSGLYDQIEFKSIPGKALLNLVSGKFLTNHSLAEKYLEWVKSQPTVKFNGYPFELATKLGLNRYLWDSYYGRNISASTPQDQALEYTIDKQFEQLIATAKEGNGAIKGNVWCALDTSGSMTCKLDGTKTSALDVCVSLGIYFSTLNEGAFHKNVIMFDVTSRVKQLSGSFTQMCKQLPADAMGSTNFQSIISEIVNIRRNHPEIPLEDYCQTLLVVSDMQFNPTGSYYMEDDITPEEETSNYEEAKRKLSSVFPQEFVDNFKIIWWNVGGPRIGDFPSTLENGGTYYFSGFDGSIISFLLGGADKENGKNTPPTMEEIVQKVLTQDILTLLR